MLYIQNAALALGSLKVDASVELERFGRSDIYEKIGFKV